MIVRFGGAQRPTGGASTRGDEVPGVEVENGCVDEVPGSGCPKTAKAVREYWVITNRRRLKVDESLLTV